MREMRTSHRISDLRSIAILRERRHGLTNAHPTASMQGDRYMKRFARNEAVQRVLLGCLILAVAGCHRNQNAQNTAAQNPSAQSATQPANPDNSAASAVTSPTPNNPIPDAAPASPAA